MVRAIKSTSLRFRLYSSFLPAALCVLAFINTARADILTGTVTDSVTGAPLKAVAVLAAGDSIPVYTDSAGVFSLDIPAGIFRSAPEALDIPDATLLRVFSTGGQVVSTGDAAQTARLADGMYLAELDYDGARYFAALLKAGTVLQRSPRGVRAAAPSAKTAGSAALTFGKSGYRFTELPSFDGTGPLTVAMPPLPDSTYPACPAEIGITDPTILDSCGTITVTKGDVIIENVDIHGIIHIRDSVANVLIRNFRITSPGYWGIFIRNNACSNIVIEDGEINGLDLMDDGINGRNFTVRRVYVHNMGGDSFKAGGNNVIEQCYITAIGQEAGAHGDGVQMMGLGDIRIRWNNFQVVVGTVNACVFPGGGGYIPDVLVEGNRLNGGGYTVWSNADMTVRNNIFGRDYVFGIRTGDAVGWTGNTWEDTGEEAR